MSKAGSIGIAILALVIGAVIGYLASPAKTVTQTVTATQTATLTQTATQISTTTVTQTATVTQSAPPPAAQPLLIPVSSATVAVNATAGATVRDGPIIVVIRPGTYAMVGNTTLSAYNFSIVLYRVVGVGPAPDGGVPTYAFAFAVNGRVSPAVTLVDLAGKPKPVITLAYMPNNWGSWTWLGYAQAPNGTLVGGRYAFVNTWHYLKGAAVNVQFVKPVPWIFTAYSTSAQPQYSARSPSINATGLTGLIPVEVATATIDGASGSAVEAGNIIAVVPPGTYLQAPNGTIYKSYEFGLVYYAVQGVQGVGGMAPLVAYAFAANGVVSPGYTFVDSSGKPAPVVTIAVLPEGTTSWTWLPPSPSSATSPLAQGSYKFPNTWIQGYGYIVNVQFVKPVPWIFLGPPPSAGSAGSSSAAAATTTATTTSSTSTTTSS
ncbi:MAG: hypothetical protein JZD41_09185 [Thermoproteus sp.]|nr:hypothetical protein [Thermoproteus sp.]